MAIILVISAWFKNILTMLTLLLIFLLIITFLQCIYSNTLGIANPRSYKLFFLLTLKKPLYNFFLHNNLDGRRRQNNVVTTSFLHFDVVFNVHTKSFLTLCVSWGIYRSFSLPMEVRCIESQLIIQGDSYKIIMSNWILRCICT